MIAFLRSLFSGPKSSVNDAAQALCNRLTAYPSCPAPTRVLVLHAQCINSNGEIRMYTDDGKQYLVTVTEMGS